MRKKILVSIVLVLAQMFVLTACGSSSGGYNSGYYGGTTDGFAAMNSTSSDAYYESSGFSNGTYISGEYADYSYSFSAEGKTKKSHQYMLDYYEELQELVIENSGYMSTVNNNYQSYVIDPDATYISNSAKHYKSSGQLRFNIQIKNEYIDTVVESLKAFCEDNNFAITAYNQNIVNYEAYEVVDDDEEIEWYDRGNKITQSELERRLKYADFYVSIYYYTPRSWFAQVGIGIREAWLSFWDSVGEVFTVFLAFGLGFLVFFIEGLIFYRIAKRVAYKNRKKHPQYYAPKEMHLVDKRGTE